MGATNIAGRVIVGAAASKAPFHPPIFMIAGYGMGAAATSISVLCNSFTLLAIYCGFFGLVFVEQYLQSSKAQVIGEDFIAKRIMATNDLVRQKCFGSNAKGNIAAWRDVAKQVVQRAVKGKFMQGDTIHRYLRTTGSKRLVEASTDPPGELDCFSEILTAQTKLIGKDPTGWLKFS
ncbi:hypothetical protein LSH36_690g04035 [Paralvinella palmiformis]|uniref:NADAR domain-containing protein n=1 Tax=Paralvinella palmiformis TaxID=53620 RepID=A0AAD9J3B1_9ANNE|nr:hypothetical protein LSH36_690g04035 [Paralvinella palmiformis]